MLRAGSLSSSSRGLLTPMPTTPTPDHGGTMTHIPAALFDTPWFNKSTDVAV